MMHALITFLEAFLLLLIAGTVFALVLLPKAKMALAIALGLPLGAFLNVLIVFSYTVLSVPLTFVTITLGHLAVTVFLIVLIYRRPVVIMDLEYWKKIPKEPKRHTERVIGVIALMLVAISIAYSAIHAVALPTVQYDSATNWTMRSKISFLDQHIAFDPTEVRGMAKPQYPFLFHALQITANKGQRVWSDTAANTMLYILSIATFSAVFLLIHKMRGALNALAIIAAILTIPLLHLHLAQGYSDLNLLQYLLLSLACLAMWIHDTDHRKNRWLVLSGIFVAAAAWTKSEGIVFGFLPWMITVGLLCGTRKHAWRAALPAIITACALSFPWPIFAWLKGISLTPHSSDTMLQLHPEGVPEAIIGLFGRGSFGITWYALAVLVPVLVFFGWKQSHGIQRRSTVLMFWGSVTFLEILFIYLGTPNVRFLLNAESFYRQMMIPAAMLILACGLCIEKKHAVR